MQNTLLPGSSHNLIAKSMFYKNTQSITVIMHENIELNVYLEI